MPLNNRADKPRVFILPLKEVIPIISPYVHGINCLEKLGLRTASYSTGYGIPEPRIPAQQSNVPEKQTLWQSLITFLNSKSETLEALTQGEDDKHYYFEFNTTESAQLFAERVNAEHEYRAVVQ